MALSKCPSCDNYSFEMAEAKITHSTYQYYFIQCSSCGAVITAVPYHFTNELIIELAKKLRVPLL